jgi:CDP-diacylglycerol--glycerol-3-phosphate 3-phosphatidyltransferase
VADPPLKGTPSERAAEAAERARLTFRRLFGLDRSGPPPPETLRGQPLQPWTIPNLIGYVRLALIPVFLVLAFSSGDGQSALAVIVFGVIGWSDYFDGIAARLTGQYSRLGALLDPLVDRLLVLAGAVVCWNFELLPRWALAVLAVRELFMLFLVRWGLRQGADIKINWLGRLGVWPVFSALFFAMAGLETVGAVLLYIGVAMVLGSTVQYVREGLRFRATRPSSTG